MFHIKPNEFTQQIGQYVYGDMFKSPRSKKQLKRGWFHINDPALHFSKRFLFGAVTGGAVAESGEGVPQADSVRPLRPSLQVHNLETGRGVTWNDPVKLSGYKKSCSSVWCKDCFKRKGAQRVKAKLRWLNWKKVRMITLTVDRTGYENDPESFWREKVAGKNLIGEFLKKIRKHINVGNYVSILEWHKDGFPHWHVNIENDGKIGKHLIQSCWGFGVVWESFVKSKEHWRMITGYYGNKGYFASDRARKNHQLELPEWAMESYDIIRKISSSINLDGTQKKEKKDENIEKTKRLKTSYKHRLTQCGKKTIIKIEREGKYPIYKTYDLTYQDFKGAWANETENKTKIMQTNEIGFWLFDAMH